MFLNLLLIIAITCESLKIGSVEGLEVTPRSCINSNRTIPYGTLCVFECRDGYQLKGPVVKSCTQSKILEPSEGNPSCEGFFLSILFSLLLFL